ncbi:unnamed protein product [Brassica napus]|uniref:(rape) hypothetical protein n=1 Tax=Brassica napus TaxID=3708 RepID=A0A816QFZ2_BRANA|nr:unnamed protein product [Brassica napus]
MPDLYRQVRRSPRRKGPRRLHVLARGVSDLDLNIVLHLDLKIPGDYYQLKINYGIGVGWVAGRVFLPLLKTLILDTVPELVLTHVVWKGMDVTVSSASLKTLTINSIFVFNALSFDTPSLLHFECSGFVASDYPLVNMGNLVDAQIDFFLSLVIRNVWNFFHGLRNAPNLDLFPDTLEVLSMCSESMPVFNNLKSLAIESHKSRGWQAMPALLRNCPNLETLGLVHRVTDKCGDVCCCISREDKGLSLTLCPVKVMKVHGFEGTMEEMAMIKHFLDYFPCLKEMEVYAAEENNNPTRVGGNQRVLEMFELYNKLSSCNVQLRI